MEKSVTVYDAKQTALAEQFGALIRWEMKEQSVSTRQLSKLSGISAATISRIATGKQLANLYQVYQFSQYLKLPAEALMQIINASYHPHPPEKHTVFTEVIQDILDDLQIDLDTVIADIEKELKKLQVYARTLEGKKQIYENFPSKINAVDGTGPVIEALWKFYAVFCAEETREEIRALVGSALLYFVLTIEVIPDYMFPLGYLDDALAVKLVEEKYQMLTNKD